MSEERGQPENLFHFKCMNSNHSAGGGEGGGEGGGCIYIAEGRKLMLCEGPGGPPQREAGGGERL